MSETYDHIEITNSDGTKRELTESDFSHHKVFDCGCRISTGNNGWPITQFQWCKPDCTIRLLWNEGRLSSDGQIMCPECCKTDNQEEWCSRK